MNLEELLKLYDEKKEFLKLINLVNTTEDISEDELVKTKDDKPKDGWINPSVYEEFLKIKNELNSKKNGFRFNLESGYRPNVIQQKKFIAEILHLICDEILTIKSQEQIEIYIEKLPKKKVRVNPITFSKNIVKKVLRKDNVQSIEDKLKLAMENATCDNWNEWYQALNRYAQFKSDCEEICNRDFLKMVLVAYNDVLGKLKANSLIDDDMYSQLLNRLSIESKKVVDFPAMIPGSSEHQSGLAFDIGLFHHRDNVDIRKYPEKSDAFMKLAPSGGFILRYPKGKEIFTGVQEEVWHYRYVGSSEIANEIMSNNLTLEEFHIALIILQEYKDKKEQVKAYMDSLLSSADLSFIDKIVGKAARIKIESNRNVLEVIKKYVFSKFQLTKDDESKDNLEGNFYNCSSLNFANQMNNSLGDENSEQEYQPRIR